MLISIFLWSLHLRANLNRWNFLIHVLLFCFLKYVAPFWSITNSLQVQSCPTLCDPMDCSLLGSSIYGIFQARILEWVALSFSRSSQPRDWTQVSRTVGRHFTIWATREILWSINLAVEVSWKSTFCNAVCLLVSIPSWFLLWLEWVIILGILSYHFQIHLYAFNM